MYFRNKTHELILAKQCDSLSYRSDRTNNTIGRVFSSNIERKRKLVLISYEISQRYY